MNVTSAITILETLLDLEEYSIETPRGAYYTVPSWVDSQKDLTEEKVSVTLADDNRSSLTAVLDNGSVEFTALYFEPETLVVIDCLRTILQG